MWFYVAAILHIQLLTGIAYGAIHDATAMIGVDCTGSLLTRSHINGEWRKTNQDSCCIKSIAIIPGDTLDKGTLVGVGPDDKLHTKQSPSVGSWTPVPVSESHTDYKFLDVAVIDDKIVGVTTDEKLVERNKILDDDDDWKAVTGSYSCVSIAAYSNGTILGVTSRGVLKQRPGIQGVWSRVTGGRNIDVVDISIQPDDTVFGIGSCDGGLHILEDKKWGPMLDKSQHVKSIVSHKNLRKFAGETD
ncbi:uncharacterized protein LOC144446667 [Glandiceps talaboti]